MEEKAFQVKGESPYKAKIENSSAQGRGRGGYRGRGRVADGGKGQFGDQHQSKSNFQCRYCKKFGHKEAQCWSKQRDESKEANFATKVVKESHLFMVHSSTSRDSTEIWFLDNGCSNHMSGTKSLFKELDES